MDNRINEIRKQIRALRISMLEAEAIMREQINRDDDCSFVAEEVLKMRVVMSLLVEERTRLGDHEPILVNRFMIPRRAPFVKPTVAKLAALRLKVLHELRQLSPDLRPHHRDDLAKLPLRSSAETQVGDVEELEEVHRDLEVRVRRVR